ncbi:hypothetical protein LCGC14_0694250 [marine sediment metagenome]|uniref:Uncharacterized protein n=1 Tax=marine sediment metagenome TaxID=412755 RepID=A0A0F9TSI1_9ZZZZ
MKFGKCKRCGKKGVYQPSNLVYMDGKRLQVYRICRYCHTAHKRIGRIVPDPHKGQVWNGKKYIRDTSTPGKIDGV